jgi:DNA polymerase III subunit alpha
LSLHVHSEFSSLDGWSTVDEIGDRMLDIGCPFCGLTDHGVVAGHIAFDKAMRKRGLNPVFGAELYHGVNFSENLKARDQAHLIALAMTDEGLRNLWRLVNATAVEDKFYHVGRVSNEDIVKYKEGIIFTSACPLGLVPQGLLREDTSMLNWYLNELGDNFRIELTTYPGDVQWSDTDSDGNQVTPRLINEMLVEVAQERGIPLTYGDDGHYARPDQFEQHDTYIAAQTGQTIFTPIDERKQYHPPGAVCIKDLDMVQENLGYLSEDVIAEAITNTWEIGEKADAHLPGIDRPHMPVFIPSDSPYWDGDDDATSVFIDLVEQGIERIYGGTEREAEAWERAIHEMGVLIEDGLENYFLMAWDVMQFCDEVDINRGPGRGSSAGCIVAYALGITDVDPLHYDLYFERFWNQGRADGFPDIDSDFARSRRGEIREYLIKRWGEKRVCSIGTIIRMKPLATIGRFVKTYGISFGEEAEIKKIVKRTHDIDIHGTEQIGWNPELEPGKVIYVNHDVGEEIEEWIGDNERRRNFIGFCERACSRNSTYGVHPSGIVVSNIDLDDYAPAYLRGKKESRVAATLFPMKLIDYLKLLKLDVLGLKTLDTLAAWQEQMVEKGINIDWSGMDRDEYPDEMWDLLTDGYVAGIFQIETTEGKEITKKVKPRSVEDLGIIVALNNPGPSRSGVPDKFAARREGKEEVSYAHPLLEEILKPTYGLFVYQEQIIRFMGALGYSLNDADAMRKILGKKQPEKLGALFKGEGEWEGKGFLVTALEKGLTQEAIEHLWKEWEAFASYSFNKSHSIAYGILAFRGLVAKYYAPEEFYMACIRTVKQQDKADLMPQYIREAKRMGIEVQAPDIRYSKEKVSVHDGTIYFGFSDVTSVASSGVHIEELRDQGLDTSDPDRFLADLEAINDKFLAEKKAAAKEGKPYPKDMKSPKQKVNSAKIQALYDAGAWDAMGVRQISLADKQQLETKFLGVILTDNSLEILAANQDAIEECDSYDAAVTPWEDKESLFDWTDNDGDEIPDNKRFIEYRLPGTINNIRLTRVKASGAGMGIVTIEYEDKELTFACFSKKWKNLKFLFKPRNTGIFTIRHTAPNDRRGEGYHLEEGFVLNV